MKKLLLVDYSNTMYRALFTGGNLSFGNKFTGGTVGFINAVAKRMEDLSCDIIVCHDRKPYLRKQDHDEYKGDRDPSANPELRKKVKDSDKLLAVFLRLSGLPQLKVAGFEADDLIALCVDQIGHKYDEIHILSNDSDLYQLFYNDRVIFHKTKGALYDINDYVTEYGHLDPDELPYMTAMVGSHNGVPGLKGVGPVTASNLIKHYKKKKKSLDLMLSEYKGGEFREVLMRNKILATVPYPPIKSHVLIIPRRARCKESELLELLFKYGIKLTKRMRDVYLNG